MSSYQLTADTPHSRMLYIDSRDATTYLATRQDGFPITSFFKFVFKEAILVERAHEMLVSLNSVSIPYTFYNIRQGVNDRIPYIIRWQNHLGVEQTPITRDITLKSGNYPSPKKTKTAAGYVIDDPFADEVLSKILIGTATSFPNNTLTMVADTEQMRYNYTLTSTGSGVDHATSIEFFPDGHAATPIAANKEMGFADSGLVSARTLFSSLKSQNVYDFFGSVHGLGFRVLGF